MDVETLSALPFWQQAGMAIFFFFTNYFATKSFVTEMSVLYHQKAMKRLAAHILSVTNRSMRHIAAVQHHLHMSRSNNPPRQPGSHVYDAERGTIRRYD